MLHFLTKTDSATDLSCVSCVCTNQCFYDEQRLAKLFL